MKLIDQIRRQLQEGNWSLTRHGKHELWTHPNGSKFTLGTTARDRGHKRSNYMKLIERLELMPAPMQETPGALVSTPEPQGAVPCPEPMQVAPEVRAQEPVWTSVDAALGTDVPPPDVVEPWRNPRQRVQKVSGSWMRSVRLAHGLTIKDLVQLMSQHAWDRMTVSNIESGTRSIHEDEWATWSEIFGEQPPPGIRLILGPASNRSPRVRIIRSDEPAPTAAPVPTPKAAPVPTPKAAPTAAPAIKPREALAQQAAAILGSPRITDAEASRLLDGLRQSAAMILLAAI